MKLSEIEQTQIYGAMENSFVAIAMVSFCTRQSLVLSKMTRA